MLALIARPVRLLAVIALLQAFAACSAPVPTSRPSPTPSPAVSPSPISSPTPTPSPTPDPFASFSPDPNSSDPEIAFVSRLQVGAPLGALSCKGCDLSYTTALKGKSFFSADLSGSNLRGSDLSGIYAGSIPMACASPAPGESGGCSGGGSDPKWTQADLRETRFVEARLEASDFGLADLRGADFSRAHIRSVSFSNADLRGARFDGADLQDVDLLGARIDPASFKGASMNHVLWSKSLRAVDPSDPLSRENRICYHGLTPDHPYYSDQAAMPCPVN